MKRRYGYRRVYLRLRREGWQVNRKRVYRLYRDAGLAVRRRKRKRIGVFERKPLPKPTRANVSWSMDFVADGLIGGRRLRCLTIVDDCTRECLAIEVDTSIRREKRRESPALATKAAAGQLVVLPWKGASNNEKGREVRRPVLPRHVAGPAGRRSRH